MIHVVFHPKANSVRRVAGCVYTHAPGLCPKLSEIKKSPVLKLQSNKYVEYSILIRSIEQVHFKFLASRATMLHTRMHRNTSLHSCRYS